MPASPRCSIRAMQVVAIANLKGGVGKTTLAVNLACALPGRVVLVDADAQGSASDWLGADSPAPVEVLPLESDAAHDVVAWADRVRSLQADIVVIDCPPHLSAVTGAALGLCDLVLLPCGPSVADVRATARTVELIRLTRKSRKGKPLALVVPNRVDTRSTTGKGIALALAALDERVGPQLVTRQAHADATGSGTWVGGYAPRSPAALEIEALARAVSAMLNRRGNDGHKAT